MQLERRLLGDADTLVHRSRHGVDLRRKTATVAKHRLSAEQERAVHDVTAPGDLKTLVGVGGSGKSTALAAMREVWEGQGYTVKGAALAGIAAEGLEVASGIKARTLAGCELAWAGGRDPLSKNEVLVIDEVSMLGSRQLQRVLEVAEKARAKVVLVGDPEQLQAIEAGAPFRSLAATHGVASLTEVRRQRTDWQRTATQDLSSGKTAEALSGYRDYGNIVAVEQRADARNALVARWAYDAKREPQQSQLVLAYTRDDVKELNSSIRTLRQQTGQLGSSGNGADRQRQEGLRRPRPSSVLTE